MIDDLFEENEKSMSIKTLWSSREKIIKKIGVNS
jgi:hypothetical protein